MRCLSIVLLAGLVVITAGCGGRDPFEPYPPGGTVVLPPGPAEPIEDVPPGQDRPEITDAEKASLMYQARLDLLRVMLCSEESVGAGGRQDASDSFLQAAKEHFTNIGFRVVEANDCLGYNASSAEIRNWAFKHDVDLMVLFDVRAETAHKFGNFYSYEARARGKVMQISDRELVTTASARVRGERELSEAGAARSALEKCGGDLAAKMSDEILRKTARGLLLRRMEVDGLANVQMAERIRVKLSKKPGVEAVRLTSWDADSRRALYWVRINPAELENLASYIQEIRIGLSRIRVVRLDKEGPGVRR